jgi:hypothetical protein
MEHAPAGRLKLSVTKTLGGGDNGELRLFCGINRSRLIFGTSKFSFGNSIELRETLRLYHRYHARAQRLTRAVGQGDTGRRMGAVGAERRL